MALATYPDIGYSIGFTIAPSGSAARTRTAPNGRMHVQHLGVYDDSTVELTHPLISEDDMASLRAFWDHNRDQEFYFIDHAGRAWFAQFSGKPIEQHNVHHYWTVTARLILRRADQ